MNQSSQKSKKNSFSQPDNITITPKINLDKAIEQPNDHGEETRKHPQPDIKITMSNELFGVTTLKDTGILKMLPTVLSKIQLPTLNPSLIRKKRPQSGKNTSSVKLNEEMNSISSQDSSNDTNSYSPNIVASTSGSEELKENVEQEATQFNSILEAEQSNKLILEMTQTRSLASMSLRSKNAREQFNQTQKEMTNFETVQLVSKPKKNSNLDEKNHTATWKSTEIINKPLENDQNQEVNEESSIPLGAVDYLDETQKPCVELLHLTSLSNIENTEDTKNQSSTLESLQSIENYENCDRLKPISPTLESLQSYLNLPLESSENSDIKNGSSPTLEGLQSKMTVTWEKMKPFTIPKFEKIDELIKIKNLFLPAKTAIVKEMNNMMNQNVPGVQHLLNLASVFATEYAGSCPSMVTSIVKVRLNSDVDISIINKESNLHRRQNLEQINNSFDEEQFKHTTPSETYQPIPSSTSNIINLNGAISDTDVSERLIQKYANRPKRRNTICASKKKDEPPPKQKQDVYKSWTFTNLEQVKHRDEKVTKSKPKSPKRKALKENVEKPKPKRKSMPKREVITPKKVKITLDLQPKRASIAKEKVSQKPDEKGSVRRRKSADCPKVILKKIRTNCDKFKKYEGILDKLIKKQSSDMFYRIESRDSLQDIYQEIKDEQKKLLEWHMEERLRIVMNQERNKNFLKINKLQNHSRLNV